MKTHFLLFFEETTFLGEGFPIHGETPEMEPYGMTPPQEALLLLLHRVHTYIHVRAHTCTRHFLAQVASVGGWLDKAWIVKGKVRRFLGCLFARTGPAVSAHFEHTHVQE